MSMKDSLQGSLMLAGALLLGGAAVAAAQARPVLRWSGQVDRDIDITIRGGQAYTSGQDSRDRRGSIRVQSALPRQDGQLSVRLLQGRGSAVVVQQPARSNNYTAIVRVQDPQSGVGQYSLDTYWDGYANGQYDSGRYGNNGNGRGIGRGGNGRYGTGDNNGRYGHGRGNHNGVGNGNGRGNGSVKGQIGDRGQSGGYGGANRGSTHGSMSWSGTVDDQAEIRIQGSRESTRTISGAAVRDVRVGGLRSGLPTVPVQVRVSQSQGRGQAWVVQQPTAQNGYTAVIRVRDPQSGASYYNLNVSW
jgi:hypothetical protein